MISAGVSKMGTVVPEDWKKEFVRLLEKSTTQNELAEKALELKRANLPERICKYRRNSDHSRDNLKNNTLWMCSPNDYNDPFDCLTKVSLGRVEFALLRGLIRKFLESRLGLTHLSAYT